MKTFAATREQRDELEGLAYWVSDRAWSRERGELNEHEDHRTDTTIRAIFDQLDRLAVPYWVQNAVIRWAEDWRRTMRENLRDAMRAEQITL
nr:MAG TPA: hypothetical protein [Caudoviricetes sp.]